VSAAVLEQLADIRTNGVPANEFASATETIRNALELFSNEQINDEILDALVDPAGNASLNDFLQQASLLGSISRNDISGFVRQWVPDGQYIEIRVLPR
jgi:hypothetical protein